MLLSIGPLYLLWVVSGKLEPTANHAFRLTDILSRITDGDDKTHAGFSSLSWSNLTKPNESRTFHLQANVSDGFMEGNLRSTTAIAATLTTPAKNVRNLTHNLYIMAPEIFDTVPQAFLPDLKTPCWYWDNTTLSCLPYFYLLGMPKCGTTDLWYKMSGHHQILSINKEAQWWTRARLSEGDIYKKLQSYTQRQRQLLRPDLGKISNLIYGDGSPSTYWDNRLWRNYSKGDVIDGPEFTIADILHTVQPNVKLIVMFREPIERLYSDYLYTKKSTTPAPIEFQEFLSKRLEELQSCVNRTKSMRMCIYDVHPYTETRYFISLYWIYTRDWLKVFPREQIKFIELADWKANCSKRLPEVFEFLEVDPLEHSRIQSICKSAARNVNFKKKTLGSMLPQSRKHLEEFYRPFNQKLFELLQDSTFDYNRLYT